MLVENNLTNHKNNLMREERERKRHVTIDAIEMHQESRLLICGTSPWNWISHAKGHGYFDVHLNNPKPQCQSYSVDQLNDSNYSFLQHFF